VFLKSELAGRTLQQRNVRTRIGKHPYRLVVCRFAIAHTATRNDSKVTWLGAQMRCLGANW